MEMGDMNRDVEPGNEAPTCGARDRDAPPRPQPRVPAHQRAIAIVAGIFAVILTAPVGIVAAMSQDACVSTDHLGCSVLGGHILVSPAFVAPYVCLALLIVAVLGLTLPPKAWWRTYAAVLGVQALAILAAFIVASDISR